MAAIPISVQLIDAFAGSGQGIHSIILPDIFSSGGSYNVWMDKYARVRRILGYAAQGVAVTTNTGGTATRVRNLFPYRKTSGVSFTRQLIGAFDDAVDEFELFYSTDEGVTWTFIQDFGAGSINSICDFAQFGDELYITNGVVAPRVWSGTAITTAGSAQLAAPTIGTLVTGNLSGSFKWKVVPRKADGTRKQGSVASAAQSLEAQAVTVTWVADPDVTVAGYEVYRTTGTGEIYFFVDYVNGIASVTYSDNIEDLTILENRVMEEHGDAPPTSYFCVAHKQRMWYLRTDTYPQRGYYADPGLPQSVYAENYVEFQDAETQGDVITGAVGNFEGMLVTFEERSIWTVSGTGQIIGNLVDFNRTRTNAQTGAVSKRSIVRVPAGARYVDQTGKVQTTTTVALAYMTPLKDIRMFDGDNDIIISHPLSDLVATMNYQQRRKTHTLHDTTRNEISWIFASDIASEPDVAVVWNYRWGVWYEREWSFSAACEVESATEAAICLGGSSSTTIGGITYRLWSGNTANGTAFTAQWMTKTLYGVSQSGQAAPSYQKRWRWVDILFKVDQDVEILVEWLEGDAPDNAAAAGSVTITPGSDTLSTSDGHQIQTATAEAINVALASALKRAKFADINGRYLHDNGIRLRIGDSISTGSWAMEAFTVGYQVLPGLARTQSARLN